jgi:hypothetical protein
MIRKLAAAQPIGRMGTPEEVAQLACFSRLMKLVLSPERIIIYFAAALFLTGLLTFPNHTRLTATLCICVEGAVGVVYSGSFFVRRGVRMKYYDLRDRFAYAAVPFAAYALLAGGGVLTLHVPQRGLTSVAAGMLFLLAVTIRNSWALAVGVVSAPPGLRDSKLPATRISKFRVAKQSIAAELVVREPSVQ